MDLSTVNIVRDLYWGTKQIPIKSMKIGKKDIQIQFIKDAWANTSMRIVWYLNNK